MKKINIVAALALSLISYNASAQTTGQKIGENPTTKNVSAVLEIESTNKGVLFPRVTLTGTTDVTTVPNAVSALTIFNTAAVSDVLPGYYYWNGTKWVSMLNTQDLRVVGTDNHITQDAGIGSNGTDAGPWSGNVGIGSGALSENQGKGNIAIGKLSLNKNDMGDFNIATGDLALQHNTNGGNNNAYGAAALSENTLGINNSAFGGAALQSNTIGNGNIAMGSSALVNSSGSFNVAIGTSAGFNQRAGDNNITIGSLTDTYSQTGSNQLNIANNIFGTGLTGSVLSPAGNIGIGTASPTTKFEVAGKIKATSINFTGLAIYATDAAAATGGLTAGDMYKTATGELRIKL